MGYLDPDLYVKDRRFSPGKLACYGVIAALAGSPVIIVVGIGLRSWSAAALTYAVILPLIVLLALDEIWEPVLGAKPGGRYDRRGTYQGRADAGSDRSISIGGTSHRLGYTEGGVSYYNDSSGTHTIHSTTGGTQQIHHPDGSHSTVVANPGGGHSLHHSGGGTSRYDAPPEWVD